jgi:dTDP-4-amino-4,6-dideoxygalactose transaminase
VGYPGRGVGRRSGDPVIGESGDRKDWKPFTHRGQQRNTEEKPRRGMGSSGTKTEKQTQAGAPVVQRSLPGWPYFAPDEIEAATRVLESGKINYWTGDEGRRFEAEFAALAGCKYGVALANGTVALELALYAMGIGEGDDVVTTARTFIASASCAVMRGARPVMADVDRESQNVTAQTIRAALTAKTKAIIAVHLAGWPCDMDPIMELAREHGLKVIEDCAQAHGATYKGRPVGSMGDVAAFSFCQDKIMTTGGEGGMLVTNSESIWKQAWAYKDHGKSYDAVYGRKHGAGFRWLHDSFGTNWRLTEMQSAMGRIQLKKLSQWVEIRKRNAMILTERFEKLPALRVTVPPKEISHSYYKYYAFVKPERLKKDWNRDRIVDELNSLGVPCYSGSCSEIYLEKAFPPEMRPARRLPVAKELGETSLMFLIHPTLTEDDMNWMAKTASEVVIEASM